MSSIEIRPPGARTTAVARHAVGALHRFVQPKLYGVDRLPEHGPFMLVGNHTLYGLQDVPSLVYEIQRARGIHVRALGDHLHFGIPVWRKLLCELGMVRGTRENCAALLEAGEAVMVFPGGAHEVFKRRRERYQLMWRERVGFARIAVEHGCPIIPFAAVGADDTYTVLLDRENPLVKPIRFVTDRITGRPEAFIPISRGLGPTLVPRPERFYFHFAPPIDTASLAGREDDVEALRALRDHVRSGVEDGISFLLAERERDPQRRLMPRLARAVRGGTGEHVPFAITAGADGHPERLGLGVIAATVESTHGPGPHIRHPASSQRAYGGSSHSRTAAPTARPSQGILETVGG